MTLVSEIPKILLQGLVDYAGLFPPAGLAMQPVAENFAKYATSSHSFMVGRCVVPAVRLSEFQQAVANHPISDSHKRQLSVLIGTNEAADIQRIADFHDSNTKLPKECDFRVTSVEVKATTLQDIENIHKNVPHSLQTYIEVAVNNDTSNLIAAIAATGHRAKIRTGGETADKMPPCEQVAHFIQLCADSHVPFKATAGLHHPVRNDYRLTYEPNSPLGTMHGFLNVFLAAAFIYKGMDKKSACEVLAEKESGAFHLGTNDLKWHTHQLDMADITKTRQEFAMSFGSCSFTEPVDDLKSLGWL